MLAFWLNDNNKYNCYCYSSSSASSFCCCCCSYCDDDEDDDNKKNKNKNKSKNSLEAARQDHTSGQHCGPRLMEAAAHFHHGMKKPKACSSDPRSHMVDNYDQAKRSRLNTTREHFNKSDFMNKLCLTGNLRSFPKLR